MDQETTSVCRDCMSRTRTYEDPPEMTAIFGGLGARRIQDEWLVGDAGIEPATPPV